MRAAGGGSGRPRAPASRPASGGPPASKNAPAAGRPGSASQASGARRGRSDSSGATLAGLIEDVGGQHEVERRAATAAAFWLHPVDSRRLDRDVVRPQRCARRARAPGRMRPWRAPRPPRVPRRCSARRARSRARPRAGREARRRRARARERQAAARERTSTARSEPIRPRGVSGSSGGLLRLQKAQRTTTGQFDRMADGQARAPGFHPARDGGGDPGWRRHRL